MSELSTVAIFGTTFFLFEFVRYLVVAGIWALILWSGHRWTAQRKIQPNRRSGRPDMIRELSASAISVAMYALVAIGAYYMVVFGLASFAAWTGLAAFAAYQVLMAVAHDAYFYWTHRWLHHRTLFRRAHLVHHKSKAPTVWSAYSFSWIEGLIQAGFIPLWLLFVPFNDVGITVFFMHQIIRNVVGHSGYELAWPGFTRSWVTGWISTSTHHDLHHSDGNHNFALWFTWWDRLMGTEHPHYHERFEAAARPWFGSRRAAAAGPPVMAGVSETLEGESDVR